jgi:hypothetical protein
MVAVVAAAADDLMIAVAKGDYRTALQQVGHGTPANEPDAKGKLPLVVAGMCAAILYLPVKKGGGKPRSSNSRRLSELEDSRPASIDISTSRLVLCDPAMLA